jgi:hypothetical protein
MADMFNGAILFNQPLDKWNVSKVAGMSKMFNGATSFNQNINTTYDANNNPIYWNVSNVTNMADMFNGAILFNQPLDKWNVSKVAGMSSMFNGCAKFNNGELGYISISGANITPSSSSYVFSTSVLTCPDATLGSGLGVGDVVIITTASIVYAAEITEITTNTTLTLLPAYTSDITSGNIISITKQVVGSIPLKWDTTALTTSSLMFSNSTYFNQKLVAKDGASSWNMNKVTNVSSMFQGTANKKNLFNNGGLITNTSNPLNWTFNSTPTSTNWHANCVLTSGNAASNPTY